MKNKRGYTLVELILVMTVTTILLGTVITIFIQSIDMYKTDETKSSNQSSLNVAITRIESAIRKADNVIWVGDTNSCRVIYKNATEDIFTLNTSTDEFSLNTSKLTDRISEFSCSREEVTNKVTIFFRTINDSKGTSLTSTIIVILRK